MSFVKKDVVFGLVAHVGGEVLADNTVPIGAIFFVKLFLDVFGHFVLYFDIVNGPFGFLHGVCFHV